MELVFIEIKKTMYGENFRREIKSPYLDTLNMSNPRLSMWWVMMSRKGCVPKDQGMKYFKKEGEESTVSEVSDTLKTMKD